MKAIAEALPPPPDGHRRFIDFFTGGKKEEPKLVSQVTQYASR